MFVYVKMPIRAAGLIIFRRLSNDIQYLMMQTSYGEHHWTPPKGHVDPGENDMQTALRETEEEAGLRESDFKLMDYKKELNYPVKGKPKVVIYWLAELIDVNTEIKLSREHQAFEWAGLERALELAKYPDLKDVLIECNTYLANLRKNP